MLELNEMFCRNFLKLGCCDAVYSSLLYDGSFCRRAHRGRHFAKHNYWGYSQLVIASVT